MKILFTGASSFTGYWFVKELSERGHDVVAPIRKSLTDYTGLRRQRVEDLKSLCEVIENCPFGSDSFLGVIGSSSNWDLLCHHAAQVENYRSPDFDIVGALTSNTQNLPRVLTGLEEANCRKVLLTGSVFEQYEGAGTEPENAFSAYGFSKGLTSELFRHYAVRMGLKLGKFVIPNPFGPLEEPRFTHYLFKTWYANEVPTVRTPRYVRDNIHVALLAKCYAHFAEKLTDEAGIIKYGPSGYAESQGAFTRRLAREMGTRLSFPCTFELAEQTDFSEPSIRINTDLPPYAEIDWGLDQEAEAWDRLADYYDQMFNRACV